MSPGLAWRHRAGDCQGNLVRNGFFARDRRVTGTLGYSNPLFFRRPEPRDGAKPYRSQGAARRRVCGAQTRPLGSCPSVPPRAARVPMRAVGLGQQPSVRGRSKGRSAVRGRSARPQTPRGICQRRQSFAEPAVELRRSKLSAGLLQAPRSSAAAPGFHARFP